MGSPEYPLSVPACALRIELHTKQARHGTAALTEWTTALQCTQEWFGKKNCLDADWRANWDWYVDQGVLLYKLPQWLWWSASILLAARKDRLKTDTTHVFTFCSPPDLAFKVGNWKSILSFRSDLKSCLLTQAYSYWSGLSCISLSTSSGSVGGMKLSFSVSIGHFISLLCPKCGVVFS